MSIPRIAIARPVTMFMISAIIILLGGISVTRLPVDLLPDVTYPTVSVFVRYPGVGPQEIEQLITRPIEQTVSAVAGLDQLNSSSSEGSSRVSLSFAWGTDLNEAMDDMRMRLDRVRGRLPDRRRADADLPAGLERDADHEPRHRGQLRPRDAARDGREPDRAPPRARLRRRRGDDQRRAPPPDSRPAVQGEGRCAGTAGRAHLRTAPVREREHAAWRGQPGRSHVSSAQPGAVSEPRRNPQPRAGDPWRRAHLRARRSGSRRYHRRRPVSSPHQRPPRRSPVRTEAVRNEYGSGRRRHQG